MRSCEKCGVELDGRYRYAARLCFRCNRQSCVVRRKKTGGDWANARLTSAIRRGEIQPARSFACVDCGKPATEYDHRDYNRPLDVQPVCHSCNIKRGPAIPLESRAA